MKKKVLLIVVVVLLAAVAIFAAHYFSLPNYEVPFRAEAVRSVRLSNQWEYKLVEDREEIAHLISELEKIKIVSAFDEDKASKEVGGFGCAVSFELADGRQIEYHAARLQGLRFQFVDEAGNAFFARNFTPGRLWNQVEGAIPANYYFICYQGKLHEGCAAVMGIPKDAQRIGTIAGITAMPEAELECSWGKTGQNVYVWEESGKTKLAVEIQQDVWPDPQGFVIDIPTGGEAANEDAAKSWGITLSADNVTPTGMTIVCFHSGGENVAQLQTGSHYVLQRKENGSWVDVEYLPQEYDVAWTAEAWNIQKESTTFWEVDWAWLYGELAAGEYRIGKEIMNFRATGDYDKETIYADFIIE